MVPKKFPGDWCSCGDYCALNHAMVPDHYPIPHMQDFTESLHSTKIDLVCAYHQNPMEADDIPKTAVTSHFGLLSF